MGLCLVHPQACVLTSKLSKNQKVSGLRMLLSFVPSRTMRCSPQKLVQYGTRWQMEWRYWVVLAQNPQPYLLSAPPATWLTRILMALRTGAISAQ